MIKTHRNFILHGTPKHHAHVHINPIGELDIDIVESHEHHHTEFSSLSFKRSKQSTLLQGVDIEQKQSWQLTLDNKDAEELTTIIQRANDDFEELMRDL